MRRDLHMEYGSSHAKMDKRMGSFELIRLR